MTSLLVSPLLLAALLQSAPGPVTVVASVDTVLVGEPFLVGVSVRAAPGVRVSFPPALTTRDDFVQVGPAAMSRADSAPEQWRAYYRVVGWKAGPLKLPDLTIQLASAAGSGSLTVSIPAPFVRSVLPADTAGLELRSARGPIPPGFPWLWLLLVLLALILVVVYVRRRLRREEPVPVVPELSPAEEALAALEKLRAEREAGQLAAARHFDRLEGILRTYVGATREWAPGKPVNRVAGEDEELIKALRRSALARFGRLGENEERELAAVGACRAWIETEVRVQEEARRAAEAARQKEAPSRSNGAHKGGRTRRDNGGRGNTS